MEYPGIIPREEAAVLIAFVALKPGLDFFCLVRASDRWKPAAKRELSLRKYFMGLSELFRPLSV